MQEEKKHQQSWTVSYQEIGYIFLFMILFLIASYKSKAQTFSLQECKEMALKNSLSIQQIRLQQEARQEQVSASKKAFLPQINASMGQSVYAGRSINPFTNQFEIRGIHATTGGVSAGWSILNGEWYQLQKAKLENQNAELEIIIKGQEIKQKVTTAFFTLLEAQQQIKIAEKVLETSLVRYQKDTELFKSGHIHKMDFLKSQSSYLNDSLTLVIMEAKILQNKMMLAKEMNTPLPAASFSVEYPLENIETLSMHSVVSDASPMLSVFANRIKMQELEEAIAKRKQLPTLSFSAGLNTSYSSAAPRELFRPSSTYTVREEEIGYLSSNPNEKVMATRSVQDGTIIENTFFRQLDYNRGLFASASLSIPIFQKGNLRNQLSQARIQKEIQFRQQNNQKLEYQQAIEQVKLEMNILQKEITVRNQQVKIFSEVFELATMQYQARKISFSEYQNSKLQYEQALTAFMQSRIMYALKAEIFKINTEH